MKITKLVICLLAIVCLFNMPVLAEDETDYASNEDYYRQVCASSSHPDYDKDLCTGFIAYINDAYRKNLQAIVEIEGDIKEAVKNANAYQTEIDKLQVEINELNTKIETLQTSIEELQVKIEENEKKVGDLEQKVLGRMKAMQSTMHFHPYMDFLMGAKSFDDLINRSNGLKSIMGYDSEIHEQLKDIIEQLNADKKLLEEQKEELDKAKDALEDKQDDLIVKRVYYETLKEEYLKIEADLIEQGNQYANDIQTLKNNTDLNYLNTLATSGSWLSPISTSSYWRSAGTWAYPRGGAHFGMDFAAGYGTPVYAPGNGVIVHSYNGCPTTGYLGGSCGNNGSTYGCGNQLRVVVSIDGKLYGLIMCHFKKDTVAASGTVVLAGDKIAEVGSSGNSSGSHMHMEIVYLGEESAWEANGMSGLTNYVNNYNGNLSFGAGWKNYNTICANNGNTPPCRIRPEYIYLGWSY